jgi:hypothetical protein
MADQAPAAGAANPRKMELLKKYLKPVNHTPVLDRGRGGIHSYGFQDFHHDDELKPRFFGIHGSQFVAFPISFDTVYLVSKSGLTSFQFHGWMTPAEFDEIYPGVFAKKKRQSRIIAAVAVPFGLLLAGVVIWLLRHR